MKFLVVKITSPDSYEVVFLTDDPALAMVVISAQSREHPEESFRVYEVVA